MSADTPTDPRGPWYGKRPSEEELEKILRDHRAWLAAGAEGKPPHDLRGIDLSGAYLFWAKLSRAKLRLADLSGADLRGADLRGADLIRTKLSGANLIRTKLSRANLIMANLIMADLSGADLSWADLRGADLIRTNLSGANLIRTKLSRANLIMANLSRANLIMANLSRAILRGTDLSGANLNGAKIDGADITGANFDGALIHTLDFSKAIDRGKGAPARKPEKPVGDDGEVPSGEGPHAGGGGEPPEEPPPPEDVPLPDDAGMIAALMESLRRVDRESAPFKQIADAVSLARRVYTFMLIACGYVITATFSESFHNGNTLSAPSFGLHISPKVFCLVAPILLVGLFLYFHCYLARIWQHYATSPQTTHAGLKRDVFLSPWLVLSLAGKIAPHSQPHPTSRLQILFVMLLTWYSVPCALCLVWWKGLDLQSWPTTLVHILLLAITLWAGWRFFLGFMRSFGSKALLATWADIMLVATVLLPLGLLCATAAILPAP